uniref:tRNA (guanine(9)-N(1))-methyltransferase n=1 Tax=Pelusios castaneus TaxID=367368 RepID=A0A8C8S2T4_9SAUR
MLLISIVRHSIFPSAIQNGTKKGFFSTILHKLFPCRTLILSPAPRKLIPPDPTEKLDLDGWKTIMCSGLQEEVSETPEGEEDSTLAATRKLVEMWRLSGKDVPKNISEEELKKFMEQTSKVSKKKYLKFLAIKERSRKSMEIKKEMKKEARMERLQQAEENKTGKSRNTFLLQFWASSLQGVYKWRAAQSMIFGQPLVFDMAYENYMTCKEMNSAMRQLMETEGCNRRAVDPFHLHFCNFKIDGAYHKELAKRYGEAWDDLLVTVTEQSHVDVFPRNKLIYLTADSPNLWFCVLLAVFCLGVLGVFLASWVFRKISSHDLLILLSGVILVSVHKKPPSNLCSVTY